MTWLRLALLYAHLLPYVFALQHWLPLQAAELAAALGVAVVVVLGRGRSPLAPPPGAPHNEASSFVVASPARGSGAPRFPFLPRGAP